MKKINLFLFVLISITFVACSHYTELYKDENGRQIYRASCKKDITNCYQVASNVCEKGFIPMEWYGKRSQTKLEDAKDNLKTDTFGVGDGRMLFRCKE